MRHIVTFHLEDELIEKLNHVAEDQERSRSALIRYFIKEGIKRIEDEEKPKEEK